jgi:hypothetical protein
MATKEPNGCQARRGQNLSDKLKIQHCLGAKNPADHNTPSRRPDHEGERARHDERLEY